MMRGMVAGRLFKAAELKVSSSGKDYAVASIVLDGAPEGQPRFARVVAFGELAQQLAAIKAGEAFAVVGRLEVTVWTPEGKEPEPQVRIVADDLLAVHRDTGKPERRS